MHIHNWVNFTFGIISVPLALFVIGVAFRKSLNNMNRTSVLLSASGLLCIGIRLVDRGLVTVTPLWTEMIGLAGIALIVLSSVVRIRRGVEFEGRWQERD